MRRKPYTDRGISRVPCAKCGQPSKYQWSVCAMDGLRAAVCAKCDVELNRMGLNWLLGKEKAKPLIDAYRRKNTA